MTSAALVTPYRIAARDYLDAGWSPVPFPARKKKPPADPFTGEHGAYVTAKDIARWSKGNATSNGVSFVPGNIGLRLPKTVLGIDVDAYDTKHGAETLAAAEKAWGQLPATWISTSRSDGVSGIRLFRIPEGLAWPGKLPSGGGVELIRWDHRYCIVAPSVHPDTGATYGWIRPDGSRADDEFPSVDELPELPASWVEGLTSGKTWVPKESVELTPTEVDEWIDCRPKGKPCVGLARTVAEARKAIRTGGDDGGAHDAARDAVWGVLRDARDGHRGLRTALRLIAKAFFAATKERRSPAEAEAEFRRIVVNGVAKVAAEDREPEDEDLCEVMSEKWKEIDGPDPDSDALSNAAPSYPRTDVGNAKRLVDRHGTDLRFLPEEGTWKVWSPERSRWVPDVGGVEVRRRARETVAAMESEKRFYLEPKARSEFVTFVRGCGNSARLSSMISETSTWDGIAVSAVDFDANPRILATPNGIVELRPGGATFRAASRSDLVSLSTGVPYSPDSTSTEWDSFLKRFLPDEELRSWVARVSGYCLLGSNPARAFVVIIGGTSTGKTTFVEAIRAALGDYAAAFNLSLFRDSQDERPRADLVDALPKRMLIGEEGSEAWHLHADTVKRLTGGGSVRARRPFAPAGIERVPAFTPVYVANSAPTIDGADLALYRRLYVLPFSEFIASDEDDPDFRDRLREGSREAVLRWLVQGWDSYAARGIRPEDAPGAVVEATLAFAEELSDFDVFINSTCEYDAGYAEQSTDLYQAYRVWAEENGIPARSIDSLTSFGRKFARRGFDKQKIRSGERKAWYRTGIRLSPGWARRVGVDRTEEP